MIYASLAAKFITTVVALTSLFAPVELEGQVAETVSAETPTVVEIPIAKEEVDHTEERINNSYGFGDCSEFEDLVRSYDWPADTALEICRKESGGNSSAINWNDVHKDTKGNVICTTSRGLMQIACIHIIGTEYILEDLEDPEINMAIAYRIWKEEGFRPWSTYEGG